jgi:quinol monooxygenase YgiN
MPMRISGNDEYATVIVVFETTPATQDRLVEHLMTGTETFTLTKPGFMGSAFHASTDGTRVVIYAQWESVAAWQAYLADPDIKRGAEISASIARPDPHVYVVRGVFGPAPAPAIR